MPPKSKSTNLNSPQPSRAVVPVGRKDVSTRAAGHLTKAAKNRSKRDENGDKPTTARAVVLRNGKYGARGTGELMLATKLTGREKLDLLAEDLVEKSKKAILNPFRMEKCRKIAESQLHGMPV